MPVRGRARRLRTEAAAIARELEPGRQLARDRGVFLSWLDRPGRRAPGGGCPAGRAAGAPAAVAARLGFRGALACVARYGQDGRAPRSPAVFPEGGRAGLSLVAVCGPRSRSARGRRARHAECRSGFGQGTAVVAFRVPGTATFRSLSVVRSPDNPRGLSEVARFGPRARRALWWRALACGRAVTRPAASPRTASGSRARSPARWRRASDLECAALDVMALSPPGPRALACGSWLLRGPPAGRLGCGLGRHAACDSPEGARGAPATVVADDRGLVEDGGSERPGMARGPRRPRGRGTHANP